MNLEIKGKDNVPKLGPSEQAFFFVTQIFALQIGSTVYIYILNSILLCVL